MEYLKLTVSSKYNVSSDCCLIQLSSNENLPNFGPGSHISLETPYGWRNYSVANLFIDAVWQLGVKAERKGRGGSAWIVDQLELGATVSCQPPKNSFPLIDADNYLLIAGGIGITAILPMARHLDNLGKPYTLIYCARDATETAFCEEVNLLGGECIMHFDGGQDENLYDFWPIVETPDERLIYCCGPKNLMEDIEDMTGHWPEHQVKFEDFKPVTILRNDDKPFQVKLTNGDVFDVAENQTILQVLRNNGLALRSSCESGTCGSCKTSYTSGEIDHRDLVLEDREKNKKIMICVSRAKGVLELDI